MSFSMEWDEWRAEWRAWLSAHEARMRRPRVNPWRDKGKNFLADEVLGVWTVNGRTVELSELTFPDLGRPRSLDRVRGVGLTFEDGATDVVYSFEDLESALGL